jgi:hypothetical protein
MTPRPAGLVLALIGVAASAGAQTRGPVAQPPPTVHMAPTPAPLAPPTSAGPAVAPPGGLSPLLSQPGPIFPRPPQAGPSYPASPTPAPLDQQKTQAYRNDLLGQRWQLDRQGVSPGSERYREIQQQLNQPSLR